MEFSSKLLFLFGMLVALISAGDSLFLKKKVIVHHVHPEPHYHHPHPIVYKTFVKKFPWFDDDFHHDHDHHHHHHHHHHPHHDWHHPWW